ANKPATVKVEAEKRRTAMVGQPISRAVVVADDGVPKRQPQGGVVGSGAAARNRAANASASGSSGAGAGQSAGLVGTRNPAMIPPSRVTVGKVVGYTSPA